MTGFVRSFCADERGAVTVDWVVVTAMFALIGITLVAGAREGAGVMAAGLQGQLRADLPRIVAGP